MSQELRPGLRVGEFVLEEPLGEGGFATVWRAGHHAWPERKVAAKILKDPEQVALLRGEADCLARLSHDGIAGAVGMDLDHDPPYLLVELHGVRTLRDLLRDRGKLPPQRTFRIFSQIAHALAHSHELGIVHGDLKPENVLLDDEDRVRLTDFGLGRVRATEASLLLSGTLNSVREESIAGTIPYMAPEQRDGQPADAGSDVFALGIVLHEMITGRRPQPGDDPSEHIKDPPAWLDVWSQCYTRRDRRLADAGQVVRALGLGGGGGGARRVSPVPSITTRGPWTLEEVERAVCQEAGIQVAELLASHRTREEGWGQFIDRILLGNDEPKVRDARRLVWYLASEVLDVPAKELADRYGLPIVEVRRAVASVRAGNMDYRTWRGTVERLAPLPPSLVQGARKVEGSPGGRVAGATLTWVFSAMLLVVGLATLAFSPAVGMVFLAMAASGGLLGGAVIRHEKAQRRWIEANLAAIPGEDRRAKLVCLTLHTEFRSLAKTARKMLRETGPAGKATARTLEGPEETPEKALEGTSRTGPSPEALQAVQAAMQAREAEQSREVEKAPQAKPVAEPRRAKPSTPHRPVDSRMAGQGHRRNEVDESSALPTPRSEAESETESESESESESETETETETESESGTESETESESETETETESESESEEPNDGGLVEGRMSLDEAIRLRRERVRAREEAAAAERMPLDEALARTEPPAAPAETEAPAARARARELEAP